MLLIVTLLVILTIKGSTKKRDEISVYYRILVNHFQILAIIYSFRLNWPTLFNGIFEPAEKTGEVYQQFISFDCLIDLRTDDDLTANPLPLFYYRIILSFLTPFVIFGC